MTEERNTSNALVLAVSRITETDAAKAKQIVLQIFEVISLGLAADGPRQFLSDLGLESTEGVDDLSLWTVPGDSWPGEDGSGQSSDYRPPLPPDLIAAALLHVVARDSGVARELIALVTDLLSPRSHATFDRLVKYPPITI